MHEIYKINGNPAGFEDLDVLHKLAQQFLPFAHKKLGFDKPVGVNLLSDPENVKDPLGKTGYYDPNKMEITIFVDKRHVKDILRSLSHELVHHTQNCRGEFDQGLETGPGYAQKDPHMRKMEAEAYLLGNGFLFRDWEDHLKLKESKTMARSKINEGHDCAVHEGEPHAQWEARQLGKAGSGPHAVLEEDQELLEELTKQFAALEEELPQRWNPPLPEVSPTYGTGTYKKLSPEEEKIPRIKTKTRKIQGGGPEDPALPGERAIAAKLKAEFEARKAARMAKIKADFVAKHGEEKWNKLQAQIERSKAAKGAVHKQIPWTDPKSKTRQAIEAIPGQDPLKDLEEGRTNWTKGNKDELLFERLVKKWAK